MLARIRRQVNCYTTDIIAAIVYVNPDFEYAPSGRIGSFGMLSVAEEFLNMGIGSLMINKAEQICKNKKCNFMRLELLAPTNSTHPVKERLRSWYTKLGYEKRSEEDFAILYPQLKPLLLSDCTFSVYLKQLQGREVEF